jgi:acyl-CoA synthetase (AMP-forming)/AMP-acid ligase II
VPLRDLLHERVTATPELTATIDNYGRELSFGELGTFSASMADDLASMGVGPSSRVAWQLPTWTETLVLLCALSRLEAIQVPLPYAYRAHEIRAAMRQTDADLLITPGVWNGYDYTELAAEVRSEFPELASITLTSGALDRAPRFGGVASLEPRLERTALGTDVRWVFFTSGTSGAPKGVLHTDRGVTIPATTMADAFELSPSDRSAIAFPLGHIGGVNWLVGCLQSGCVLLLADRLDDTTIDSFATQGVTLAGVTTAFHLAYRDRQRVDPARPLFPAVRAYPGGAATKPPTLHAEVRDEIGGVGIVSGYGLTECPMITMSTVRDPDGKLAISEGRPGPGMQIEFHDPATGALLPPGGTGEVWVRGPQLFQGYVSAEDTKEAVDERGFFRTGDLGRLDEDGYMIITGRLKDVIIRKGENISAKEVEDHIFAHPDIADVAVVGLPDDLVGERCCAVLVPKPGRPVPEVAELGEYLRARGLMTQKWPEQISTIDALPRNAAGKVLKHDIIRELRTPSS